MNAQLLQDINTLLTRRTITKNQILRALDAGVPITDPKIQEMNTFVHAAWSRARFLKAKLG
jgi:hypothetical protein